MPAETAVLKAAVGASGEKRYSHSAGDMVSQALSRANDSELIRAAQRGDRVAFESLVRQYDQAVLRLALHLLALNRTPAISTRKLFSRLIGILVISALSARSTPGFTAS